MISIIFALQLESAIDFTRISKQLWVYCDRSRAKGIGPVYINSPTPLAGLDKWDTLIRHTASTLCLRKALQLLEQGHQAQLQSMRWSRKRCLIWFGYLRGRKRQGGVGMWTLPTEGHSDGTGYTVKTSQGHRYILTGYPQEQRTNRLMSRQVYHVTHQQFASIVSPIRMFIPH